MRKKINKRISKLLEELGSESNYKHAVVIINDDGIITTKSGIILFASLLIEQGFYFHSMKKRRNVVEVDSQTMEEFELLFWEDGSGYELREAYCLDNIEEFEKPKESFLQIVIGVIFILFFLFIVIGGFLRGLYTIFNWIF